MPTARDSNDAPHLFCIPSVVGDRDMLEDKDVKRYRTVALTKINKVKHMENTIIEQLYLNERRLIT